MTTPYERTRAVLGARQLLSDLAAAPDDVDLEVFRGRAHAASAFPRASSFSCVGRNGLRDLGGSRREMVRMIVSECKPANRSPARRLDGGNAFADLRLG